MEAESEREIYTEREIYIYNKLIPLNGEPALRELETFESSLVNALRT